MKGRRTISDRVELVWYGDDAPLYDHGPQHPLRPARVLLTRSLIHGLGLIDGERVTETPGPRRHRRRADAGPHRALHRRGEAGRAGGEPGDWWRYGFGPGDNPIFPDMHEASARVAGASLVAAEAVCTGRAEHAFNPSGGLHHAMPERASGFCVYDDPAIAIAWMLEHGAERIAYVDVDVHHGDGPQAIFYDDPRVLTISIHQSGATLFPGTGFPDETGAGEAEGTKANVALPPYTGDDAWLAAFARVVPPLVAAWKPDVAGHPAGLRHALHRPARAPGAVHARLSRGGRGVLHDLAHRAAGGRWLATGGGGYQWARVVPRAWTHLLRRDGRRSRRPTTSRRRGSRRRRQEPGSRKVLNDRSIFKELGTTPPPRWDLIDLRDYRAMMVQTTVGCRFRCDFCDIIQFNGGFTRPKTLESVRRRARGAVRARLPRRDLHRRRQLRRQPRGDRGDPPRDDRRSSASTTTRSRSTRRRASTSARPKLAHLLPLMKQAGFEQVFLGIENPDPAALNAMNKKQNVKVDIARTVAHHPGGGDRGHGGVHLRRRRGHARDGRRASRRSPKQTAIPTAMAGMLTPIPHTPLTERLRAEGRLMESGVLRQQHQTTTSSSSRAT